MSDNLNRRRVRFTHADEVTASAVAPLHHRKIKATAASLRATVDHIIYGRQAPMRFHWAEIIDAANVVEALLDLRHIDDPDGLHKDVHDALTAAGQRVLRKQVGQLRFNAKEAADLLEFVDAYEKIMGELSARQMIQAFRHTEERLERVMRGAPPPGTVVMEV